MPHSASTSPLPSSQDIPAADALLQLPASPTLPAPPVVSPPSDSDADPLVATLVLNDGSCFQGYSFGAEAAVAGECVFQTGMVGYPESLTDPSYRGQLLVLTYPLVGNYGVPSRSALDPNNLPLYFESNQIHVSALIIGHYSSDYSHYLASSSLGAWLKENNIPALFGIDTRALTKKIREKGALLGKILFPKSTLQKQGLKVSDETFGLPAAISQSEWIKEFQDIPFHDPNTANLVAQVSTKSPQFYTTQHSKPLTRPDGKTVTILAVDVGMKFNQIRCFLNRGVNVKVVPFDYDFTQPADQKDFDGLFISNGPGDPTMVKETVERLRKMLAAKTKPIFGICLGHQLLALASGAKTMKLKFGNRGHNIPCTDLQTGRCHITSQNHGYAVNTDTLPSDWQELFVNANDGSNEGITHSTLPFFSVQFHPESTPGPRDTEYLFDRFLENVVEYVKNGKLVEKNNIDESKRKVTQKVQVNKVLILGSGGLSIGQAGEFDYSGSQAIKALKEEGIYTILINPNIATIQTSKGLADKVYFLPVTPQFVRKVIEYEKPDGIYVTFGGQTALNVGIAMKDEFESLGVKVLGTPISTIILTEDRELFAQSLHSINEKCASSASATNLEESIAAGKEIGYPVIVRAAYALGGLGSGFAENEEQLIELCKQAFTASPQVLIERSMKGWKEIEYEVVRDCNDNCITVCNMENFDPLGIHTGDSIVVAPSQTLSDEDYHMLRTTAVNVIRHLGVVGECNIQYALNPISKEYCIIEVNARLSRSSALASKATGYPLAFVAAKLGLGIPLNEIKNSVTKVTTACFEPSLDYCVVKIPRWDLKKFNRVRTKIGSAMKSVGEVMSIGRNFEETIQKAIRAVDFPFAGFGVNDYVKESEIEMELKEPSDQRLFAIANAFGLGWTVEKVWEMTKIDRWFLTRLERIVKMEKSFHNYHLHTLPASLLRSAKQMGFSDRQIAKGVGATEMAIRTLRQQMNVTPFVKQIDTVAAEFPAQTNYLYMTYNAVENDVNFDDRGITVLGSGVYRIGSSVEFDWCAVRAIRTLRQQGFKTVMINYNPETVSTDYDEADRLYFENLTLERVLDIYEIEKSEGLIVSMGGQTPNNIALPLHRQGVKILGTSPEMIDTAENRYKFSRMLDKIGVDQPLWKELTSFQEAGEFCDKVGYPVLVRPSYVLSGAAMNVVFSPDDLHSYLSQAVAVSRDFPVVISKFIEEAKEIEMDAVAKDGKLVAHIVSEHVENAGVHSGDATLVLPPQDLDPETVRKIEVATRKIANALNVTGPMNIQFIAKNNEIKVIECNLRAARSFPFVSKVLNTDLIEIATKAMLDLPVETPVINVPPNYVGVKVPQFSFSRLSGADPVLGVEMASTGEVACFGRDKYEAYLKALLSTGFRLPKKNILISIGSFKEKQEFLPSIRKMHQMGYNLFATSGTADYVSEHGIPVQYLEVLDDSHHSKPDAAKAEYSLQQHLANNLIDLYINLPSKNRYRRPASYMSRGYRTRRMAVDFSIPLITNIKCAKLFVEAMSRSPNFDISNVDYKTTHKSIKLPGLINISAYFGSIGNSNEYLASNDFENGTKAALAGGFTMLCVQPIGSSGAIATRKQLQLTQKLCSSNSYTDFSLSVLATSTNAQQTPLVSEAASLFVSLDKSTPEHLTSVNDVIAHFKSWPAANPIIAHARGTDLASILLLASLYNRAVHVTDLSTEEGINIVTLSKEKGVKVTCDVSVFTLFDQSKPKKDLDALWSNLDAIDCFSIGQSNASNIHEALPLLLTAVNAGKLTIDDIQEKLYDAPRKIFDLPTQDDTYIEVELERVNPLSPKLKGFVHRVVLRDETVYLDGVYLEGKKGRDVSDMIRLITTAPAVAGVKEHSGIAVSAIPKSPARGKLGVVAKDFAVSPAVDGLMVDGLDGLEKNEVPTTPSGRNRKESIITTVTDLSAGAMVSSVSGAISTKSPFFRQNILSVSQFNRQSLHILFGVAHEMRTIVERQGSANLLNGRVLCTAFYEPSTRTCCSFESAWNRLGGSVVSVNSQTSSIAKGESFADTVRTLATYADCLVLRHPEPGSATSAAKVAKVPVINAGDGIGEHPTQAFLDVYTIREELGTVNGLTITLVGDLKNGRTVHSLIKLLSLYSVKINLVSPASLSLPEDIKSQITKSGIPLAESTSLNDFISTTDVLYVTRIQKERFVDINEYEKVKGSYIIDNDVMQKAKSAMIVMHPLPRINEIAAEVDFDPRAAYFRQMRYGLYVRMALLALVMGKAY